MTIPIANGLSNDELDFFHENGFIGPFDCVTSNEEIDNICQKILAHSKNKQDKHPFYNRYSVRDWHLVYLELLKFAAHPIVLNQLKSLLGENMLLWRSNVFYKPPGTGPIGWHQEFGTFSGEDIGNNKPSLLPFDTTVSIQTQEQNLSKLLSLASSEPILKQKKFWDVTLWVALNDIDESMGPLQLMKGSHKRRYPIRMDSLVESDFWQNPFANIENKGQLIDACNNSSLVLDIDTSTLLNDIDLHAYTFEELKSLIVGKLKPMKGSITCTDEIDEGLVVNFPMKRGSYIIFSEQTMHGSLPNLSNKERLAINFRITDSSTLIYPLRLHGDYKDGFNLDISKHSSVLLSGQNLNPNNVVSTLSEYYAKSRVI